MNEPIKVLCVDDERNVLRSLKRLFLDEDYQILTALSGKEGLQTLEREQPVQIVVSDYRMPEMNGVDFLHEVCRRWPETVRIVLSGYADTAAIVSAINEGQIYKFIPKPWNDCELKVTIDKAIDLYFLHRKNQELMTQLQHSNEELGLINENLEKMVAERTVKLEFQNKVLKSAQNILNALPVGVVGIDLGETVVFCNAMASELLSCVEGGVLGCSWRDALPEEVGAFIEQVPAAERLSERCRVGDSTIRIKGSIIQEPGQEGLILVVEREGEK